MDNPNYEESTIRYDYLCTPYGVLLYFALDYTSTLPWITPVLIPKYWRTLAGVPEYSRRSTMVLSQEYYHKDRVFCIGINGVCFVRARISSPLWFVNAAFCTSKHPTTVKYVRQILTFLPKLLHNSNKSRTFAPPEPAKPLNDAQMSGSFFYMHMTERIPFGKHYTEEQSLITLLQSRGLSITDVNKANHYLTHIGYYRLSAYMYPLLRVPMDYLACRSA